MVETPKESFAIVKVYGVHFYSVYSNKNFGD